MQVSVFPATIESQHLEEWMARKLAVELKKADVSDLSPRVLRLPLYERGKVRGVFEAKMLGKEVLDGLDFLRLKGQLEGQPVEARVEWEQVARAFGLEDAPLYLIRARTLPEAAITIWKDDLERLGIAEAVQIEVSHRVWKLTPSREGAWAFWLAAWRFGKRVGLDLGMRQETMQAAFAELKQRVPEIPDEVFNRSREAEGWGKAEIKALDE